VEKPFLSEQVLMTYVDSQRNWKRDIPREGAVFATCDLLRGRFISNETRVPYFPPETRLISSCP
jgi:hypothetical protein